MKISYLANIRLPTEKAHGIQIMEMCSAFSKQGVDVELIVPKRFNSIKEDPFVYYGIKENFSIRRLPCIDLVRFGRIGFLIELGSFALNVVARFLFDSKSIFYTRDEALAFVIGVLKKKIFWEAHMGQTNIFVRLIIHMKIPIIVLARSLRELYISKGVDTKRIIVAPDAVDISRFDINISRDEAREQLGLSHLKKIVLYKGHLYSHKGPSVLAQAASFLQARGDIAFVFIGGTEIDIMDFKSKFGDIKNIFILGHKKRSETPIYQKASNVLVIPNSAQDELSRLYSSPMKLFGYMASGVPIVASDVPALREVLNERNAIFVEPDNVRALVDGVEKVLDDKRFSQNMPQQALLDVQSYTWDKRAKSIFSFIKKHS